MHIFSLSHTRAYINHTRAHTHNHTHNTYAYILSRTHEHTYTRTRTHARTHAHARTRRHTHAHAYNEPVNTLGILDMKLFTVLTVTPIPSSCILSTMDSIWWAGPGAWLGEGRRVRGGVRGGERG